MWSILSYIILLCVTSVLTELTYSGVKTRYKGPITSRFEWPLGSQAKDANTYLSDCDTKIRDVKNARWKCTNNFCQITCIKGYIFPSGATTLNAECRNNEWHPVNSLQTEIHNCQPICEPQCKNNGICIAPDECHCPNNYFGHHCENQKIFCLSKPSAPKNARALCNAVSCSVTCLNGYTFPDAIGIANLNCENGEWVPSNHNFKKLPDCQPTCKPDCENGGSCISPNVCACLNDFRGQRCEYGVDRCSPKKMGFNGRYQCHGDSQKLSCQISCPKNVEFEFYPATLYTCEFAKGYFEPSNIPRCVYGEGASIIESSQTNYKNTEIGYGLTQLVDSDWKPMLKKIIANRNKSSSADFGSVYLNPSTYLLHQNIQQDSAPHTASCFIWDGSHLKTFDGLLIRYPLECSYTVARDREDNSFNIIMKGCQRNSTECQVFLEIYFQEVLYTLQHKDGTFTLATPKKRLPVPVQLVGIKAIRISQQVIVDLELAGLTITWDGKKYFSIEAKAGLWNRVDGLCGSFDGDPKNDIILSDHVASTLKSFVDSWKTIQNSLQCSMENKIDFNSEMICTKEQENSAASFCNMLLEINELQECLSNFNKVSLVQLCLDEYCTCKNKSHPTTCNCNVMTMLIRECQLKGKIIQKSWRSTEICPMSCESNQVYMPCGPINEPSCGSAIAIGLNRTDVCNEGCFCPPGTMQHHGDCIPIEQCPCKLRSKEFKAGHKVKKDCNTCVCRDGVWDCTNISCGARCSAVGDPHYTTFDGKRYNFMGTCSYFLVKTDNISIEAENVACSGQISESMKLENEGAMPSCTKSVTIRFKLSQKEYSIILQQGNIISVNNKIIKEFANTIGSGFAIIRQASSIFTTVDFADGLRIWWDGVTRVYIDAPSSYRGRTQGLCGTFNSNIQDEFLTPEGDIEATVEPFAEKWKVDSCDLYEYRASVIHPCHINFENKNKAESYCSKLISEIFETCHWAVDPTPFFEDCMYDVCACRESPGKCFCPIFASYGAECSRQGITTNWRYHVDECAIECPHGQVFDECGDSCLRTCEDLSNNICKGHCVEGCRCPAGQYLNSKNECVLKEKCQCSYDGFFFENGYKEVRPGNRFIELCLCSAGQWNCDIANPQDIELYPPAAELKGKCLNKEFAEFSKCLPNQPKTCKNMHSYKLTLEEDCKPGCICKDGFVLDTTSRRCVLPEDCSCHHGGKSYEDGESFQEECATCQCKNGKWNCASNECPATCRVWGDSHFTTFDKLDFDFQGVCDYILAKGSLNNGDGFSIIIQNVLCGSMGVTCSKSIKITLSGRFTDSLILSSDYQIPKRKDASNYGFSIYKSGLLTTIEVTALGFQLKWDHGTRIYVKLNEQWKGSTRGLCGNYNGDVSDDMLNPSQGLELDPLLFGHSWRLQDFCSPPQKQIDACTQHEERKAWAHSKCSVLKSEKFQSCHSAVPVDDYLAKCIYDTCACDRGGDCDCLCTAIATYAHECSMKGIPIRWRTPHFCPMQCDTGCSDYNPCISACPVETCESYIDTDFDKKMCHVEACIEGCRINKCNEGYIYINDSYTECVPKMKCRPICMIIDEKVFYEGDITHSDECHTCRCSRKKEICSGAPCSQLPELRLSTTEQSLAVQASRCTDGWSDWINNDVIDKNIKGNVNNTSPLKANDIERIPKYLNLLSSFGYGSCPREYITKIQCRVVGSHDVPKDTSDNAFCSVEKGLVCLGPCHDYEIRVFCDCGDISTTLEPITEHTTSISTCKPETPFEEIPDDCFLFKYCEQQPDGSWDYEIKTCGPTMMFNPNTKTCDWKISVQQSKPICKAVVTETPSNIEEDIISVTTSEPLQRNCDHLVPHAEHPFDCFKFLHCQPIMNGKWDFVEKSCGPTMMFNPRSMVCDWPANVLLVKPQCATLDPESIQPNMNQTCPEGQILSECAFPCGKACHYYQKQLQTKLLCTPYSMSCEKGCVNDTENIICNPSEVRRDKKTCVKPSDCPCMSNSGKFVKPNDIFRESECEMCQCLDNDYVCSKQQCSEDQEVEEFKLLPDAEQQVIKTDIPSENLIIGPSLVTPPNTCETGRFYPIINGEAKLAGITFNASSVLGTSFLPHYAKLNGRPTDVGSGSWSPIVNDQFQYLEITFNKATPVYGVIMQGSPLFDQYVTSFQVVYSFDEMVFHYVVDKSSTPQLFSGPIDPKTAIETIFNTPIEAKTIRILPKSWHNGISIRLELLGCSRNRTEKPLDSEYSYTETSQPITEITEFNKILVEENVNPLCDNPMGIDSGYVSQKQVSASSIKLNYKGEMPILLDLLKSASKNAWRPALDSSNEFLMFDFAEFQNITGIKTMGGEHGWVTAYQIFYSNNGYIWNPILSQERSPRIFLANTDNASFKVNFFTQPVRTRYLKLVPVKWEKCIEMKAEPIGCFTLYERIEQVIRADHVPPIEAVKVCPVCPGVIVSANLPDGSSCKCEPPTFWNGVHCVDRNQCPCFVGYVQYEVGSQYQSDDCQQCVCVLGGIQQCKPQQCPDCTDGLRSVKSMDCACTCESCPEFQKPCPTSGDCIPENFWCNGIQDCADDETNCTISTTTKMPHIDQDKPFKNESNKCPDPQCPSGMTIEIHHNKLRASPIFEAGSKNIRKVAYMKSKKETKGRFHKKAKITHSHVDANRTDECLEFTCSSIPTKTGLKTVFNVHECPIPECPPEFYLNKKEQQFNSYRECPKYSCLLRPPIDATCTINGRSFKTFDGVEYKYDVCNHTIVRNSQWSILVAKNCSEGGFVCRKQVTIISKDPKVVLTLFTDLTVTLNGLKFSGKQLEMSPLLGSLNFQLSQPGNSILLISEGYGFWISYDTSGTVKVGVSSKMVGKVDGLCGLYDGIPVNDKSLPGGTISESTIEFGDSWIVEQNLENICTPQVCSFEQKKSAWEICSTIRNEIFSPCVGVLDYDHFMSHCIETTCDCLRMSTEDHDSTEKKCRCLILSSFVRECLASNPIAEITNWRAVYDCVISCPAPSTHIDCYRRKCEPSCESYRLGNCPILPNVCFSGCYCPETMVRKGDTCVPLIECLDCSCDGFGKSKFITYDRQSFSIDGKCTYLLTRNNISDNQNIFEVYVTVGDCSQKREMGLTKYHTKSKQRKFPSATPHCIKSLNIIYKNHTIRMYKQGKFLINVDKEIAEISSFSSNWFKVVENPNGEVLVLLHKAKIEVTVNIADLSFSIRLPSIKYKSSLEGLCGNCNGDPNDDLKLNSNQEGKVEDSLENIIPSWRSDIFKSNEIETCSEELPVNDECIRSPTEKAVCQKILDKNVFGVCHAVVDPSIYVSACEDDICKSQLIDVALCDSIAAYVKSCFRHGICINWRGQDFCPFKCHPSMIYKSCECIPTCTTFRESKNDSGSDGSNNCISKELEGCGCPQNQMLNVTNCIPENRCIMCDDGHYFGEQWTTDKCKKCTCDEKAKIVCWNQECPTVEKVCEEDYSPLEISDPEHCCPKYICVPRPTIAPSVNCTEPLIPTCGQDQQMKQKIGPDGCTQFYCECKPLSECPPAVLKRQLNVGDILVNSTIGCCPKLEIKCDKSKCPVLQNKCDIPFYSMVEKRENNTCCGDFVCEPPKNSCILVLNGNYSQKQIGETWISPDNPCLSQTCIYGPNSLPTITERVEVCDSHCPVGTVYTTESNKCCGRCVQNMCSYNHEYYKSGSEWSSADNCTHFRCETDESDFVVMATEVSCPDVSKCPESERFKDGCCHKCKLPVRFRHDCFPKILAENETIGIIQTYELTRGLCQNKEAIINFTECNGECESGTKFNPSTLSQEPFCNCCKPEKSVLLNVTLHCNNGQTTIKPVSVPQLCKCVACSLENESFDKKLHSQKRKSNESNIFKISKKG